MNDGFFVSSMSSLLLRIQLIQHDISKICVVVIFFFLKGGGKLPPPFRCRLYDENRKSIVSKENFFPEEKKKLKKE